MLNAFKTAFKKTISPIQQECKRKVNVFKYSSPETKCPPEREGIEQKIFKSWRA
jgi:hypothetical protein